MALSSERKDIRNHATKVVRPYHGTDGAMGYKYRARTESRTVWVGWFWNRRQVTQRRFVIERHFMSWSDYSYSKWLECDEDDIKQRADTWLDHKAAAPSGDYV
jgi:hypothetical protein